VPSSFLARVFFAAFFAGFGSAFSTSNAVGFKGNLIFGDLDGYIHIIDPLNGITVGRKKITKHPIKSIFSRSNNLYVVDESFNLFSINL